MLLNNAYNQYKENSVYTARPEELTLMLYNGLVKFIMQAQHSIEEKKLDKAHASIIRAQDILFEFQATLNKKYEISQSLWLIYDYMNRRLVDANIKKDAKILEEVLGFAKELRDTWEQAMKIARQPQRMPQVATAP
jgi:flagellar protein FliS